jgi:2-polyprenyl-3-methyl-5-hydroxy-6-metoxy-1,4-benzoquinol methylase
MRTFTSRGRSAASDGEANDGEPEPFHKFNLPDECGHGSDLGSGRGSLAERMAGPNTYDVTTWDTNFQNGGIDT